MGELLLSLLELATDGTVVFSRKIKGSHYGKGDAVPFVYPNPHRKTKRQYYRILEKFYEPELIVELLRTQDPDVIDQDGKVPYQRELRDRDIYNLASQGKSYEFIGQQYKWHKQAIIEAVNRHKRRDLDEDSRVAKPEDLARYIPEPEAELDQSPLANQPLPPDQLAKLNAMLDAWGMNED